MKTSWIVGIIVVLIVIIGGWFLMSKPAVAPTSEENEYQQSSTDTSAASAPAANTVLNTGTDAKLGTYLVAANGMTLYKYTKDTDGVSNCSGTCAVNWPPYTVASATGLFAVTGITGALGIITRADGTLQVTYNGMPLYFWKSDTKPGDTTGQNVGGVWFVVKP